MRSRSNISRVSAILTVLLFLPFLLTSAYAEDSPKYSISDVETVLSDTILVYTLKGQTSPAYTVTKRFAPFRVVLDIAGASFSDPSIAAKAQIPSNEFVSLSVSSPGDIKPSVMRFTFTLADSHDYKVERVGNDIKLEFFPGSPASSVPSPEPIPGLLELKDLKISSTPNSTTVTILSNGPVKNYTVDTIGAGVNRPPRMYIDIEDVSINELPRSMMIGTSVEKVRIAPRKNGVRIVFDSASRELFKYSVAPSPDGLAVVIDETTAAMAPLAGQTSQNSTDGSTNETASATDSTLDKLIDYSEALLSEQASTKKDKPLSKAEALAKEFSFSGYQRERISVDFFKIDIHNVFRLFREVTDLNIIVDESVQGSLTLALNDVPWDFALDIILNLMNLKKEERFNTVVIYPANKDFTWPTRADDNIDFEADVEVVEQEELVIQEMANQPQEISDAKALLAQASELEKQEDFEEAAILYQKAFDLWPTNAKIANRLATLYLVNLGMNAKAVHFAQKSLELDPQNSEAALYAAIGLANMQRIEEANEYFRQATTAKEVSREALLSYAAFSENNGHYDAALKLIDKYHTSFGETLDTMVSKARILDRLGLKKDATKEYGAILASGFQMRPDLKKFIEWRLSEGNN